MQVTGYSTNEDCVEKFTYNVCTLESAIGEYDVLIENDQVQMDSLSSPRIVAIANNTEADHVLSNSSLPRSTLAAVLYIMYGRFSCYRAMLPVNGELQALSIGSIVFEDYETALSDKCPSYSDPLEDVLAAMNRSTSIVYSFVYRL